MVWKPLQSNTLETKLCSSGLLIATTKKLQANNNNKKQPPWQEGQYRQLIFTDGQCKLMGK